MPSSRINPESIQCYYRMLDNYRDMDKRSKAARKLKQVIQDMARRIGVEMPKNT